MAKSSKVEGKGRVHKIERTDDDIYMYPHVQGHKITGMYIRVLDYDSVYLSLRGWTQADAHNKESGWWRAARMIRNNLIMQDDYASMDDKYPDFWMMMTIFGIDVELNKKESRGTILYTAEFTFTEKYSDIVGLYGWIKRNWRDLEHRNKMFPDIEDRFFRELIFGKFMVKVLEIGKYNIRFGRDRRMKEISIPKGSKVMLFDGKAHWIDTFFRVEYQKSVVPQRVARR